MMSLHYALGIFQYLRPHHPKAQILNLWTGTYRYKLELERAEKIKPGRVSKFAKAKNFSAITQEWPNVWPELFQAYSLEYKAKI